MNLLPRLRPRPDAGRLGRFVTDLSALCREVDDVVVTSRQICPDVLVLQVSALALPHRFWLHLEHHEAMATP